MQSTVIQPLPNEFDIRNWVDNLITPENADREAPLLAKLLLTVSNADDDELYHLATYAAKHAFTKTSEFQAAFESFAGLPDTTRPRLVADTEREEEIIEFDNEL